MRNRIPTKVLDNGAIRYAVYDENGALLRYEYMLPADEPTDPGTQLNKETLLSDDVEALIWGAAADRTPNDAFGKISELYQHWWSVLHGEAYSYYVDVKTPVTAAYELFNQATSLRYSKNIDIDDTGTISLREPTTLTVDKSNLDSVKAVVDTLVSIAPAYIECNDVGGETKPMRYIPEGATGQTYTSNSTNWPAGATASIVAIYDTNDSESVIRQNDDAPEEIRLCNLSTERIDVPAGETTYVHSPDRNAYPDSGTVDGLTYKYLGVPFDNARTAAAVEVGSYTGTGTAGASNPNTLSFGFEPKLVIVADDSLARFFDNDGSNCYFCIFVRGMKKVKVKRSSTNSSAQDMKLEWSGKSLSWYYVDTTYTGYPVAQLNESGTVYVYVAIG